MLWAMAERALLMTDFDAMMTNWAEHSNPFYSGASAEALTLLPYTVLLALLLWVAREKKQP